MFRIGSLFAGIGGLELGLERAGVGRVVWQVEIDDFRRGVLAKNWPHARQLADVREVRGEEVEPVEVLCGGFPCQDVSVAGKRVGLQGARSGLWSEYRRLVGELRPIWVVIENVQHTWRKWVPFVRGDLYQLGYASVPLRLSAADVGAWHRRRRVFVLAHADGQLLRQLSGRWGGARREVAALALEPRRWGPRPEPRRGDDGLPNRVDRVSACGDAVVPQVAEVIGHMIVGKVSRFSPLSEAQYYTLRQVPVDFMSCKLTWRANTLYKLEELGFIERDPSMPRDWSAPQLAWRRTEKGTTELNRLSGAKD